MPLVSVLVTFYNQKEYVARTIDSILGQKTDFEIEIIAGDDGSNDGTTELLYEFEKKHPQIIRTVVGDRNDGVSIAGFRASRNRLSLLKKVSGKYFIFLDGDDYFTDCFKLQKQVDILENPDNQDCVACSHYIDALYPDGHIVKLPTMEISEGRITLREYWPGCYFHTDTTLVRSSCINSIPSEYVANNYNDNLITFLIFQCGTIYFIPDSMAIYYQTGDGIWTSQKAIKNHIRNIFLFDICIKLDPGMRRETEIRFSKSWEYLFKHLKEIRNEGMEAFVEEAINKDLKYSILFLRYDSISFMKKIKLYFRMGSVFANHCLYKIIRK